MRSLGIVSIGYLSVRHRFNKVLFCDCLDAAGSLLMLGGVLVEGGGEDGNGGLDGGAHLAVGQFYLLAAGPALRFVKKLV